MMFEESVGSNSSSVTAPALGDSNGGCGGVVGYNVGGGVRNVKNSTFPHLSPPLQSNQQQQRFCFGKMENTCFYCQKKGHWVKDCPNKNNTQSSKKTTQSSSCTENGLPILLCPCGAGSCPISVSRKPNNPGRKFFACPLYPSRDRCKFFKWCDDQSIINDIIYPPTCECGAGPCCLTTEISGPYAGCRVFVCPIKKGQGACCFIQPLYTTNNHVDGSTSSPQSTLTNCHEISPSASDIVEERDLSYQGVESESPVVATLQHPPELGTTSKHSGVDKMQMVNFQRQENISEEPLRRHYKRLRHGAPKIDHYILDSTSGGCDMLELEEFAMEKSIRASVIKTKVLIQQRQAEFLWQISSDGASLPGASLTSLSYGFSAVPTTTVLLMQNCLETTVIHKILGFHIEGWCGRLVFPPPHCLSFPSPKPFFCCVFPSFDPIFVPQEDNISGAKVSTITLFSLPSSEPSTPSLPSPGQRLGGLEPPPHKILQGNTMTQSILDAFEQAAAHIQDDLLQLLESMDFHDHESMIQVAKPAFVALEGLSMDHQSFKERVMEFIESATLLSEVESCMLNECCEEEVVDRYNCQEMHFEDISGKHVETSVALRASNDHLNCLRKEALCIKEMLYKIEVEMLCCEAENRELNSRLGQISEDMHKSELCVQVTKKAAEEAQRRCRQREAKWDVAKVSFEKARTKLRESYM